MTRLSPNDLKIPDRLPEEGFHRLHKHPGRFRTKIEAQKLDRQWRLVKPGLREVLTELANAKQRWPLFLWGGVGVGKTQASQTFALRVERGYYWTVGQIMTLAPSEQGAPWQWAFGYPPGLTVLDELGLPRPPGKAQAWDYDCVKDFLDWRGSRPAIYVSNHDLKTLERIYDTRIVSRLSAGTVFELRDHDRRRR